MRKIGIILILLMLLIPGTLAFETDGTKDWVNNTEAYVEAPSQAYAPGYIEYKITNKNITGNYTIGLFFYEEYTKPLTILINKTWVEERYDPISDGLINDTHEYNYANSPISKNIISYNNMNRLWTVPNEYLEQGETYSIKVYLSAPPQKEGMTFEEAYPDYSNKYGIGLWPGEYGNDYEAAGSHATILDPSINLTGGQYQETWDYVESGNSGDSGSPQGAAFVVNRDSVELVGCKAGYSTTGDQMNLFYESNATMVAHADRVGDWFNFSNPVPIYQGNIYLALVNNSDDTAGIRSYDNTDLLWPYVNNFINYTGGSGRIGTGSGFYLGHTPGSKYNLEYCVVYNTLEVPPTPPPSSEEPVGVVQSVSFVFVGVAFIIVIFMSLYTEITGKKINDSKNLMYVLWGVLAVAGLAVLLSVL